VKKEQNGRESLRRLKHTVGCNASKRRRRRYNLQLEYLDTRKIGVLKLNTFIGECRNLLQDSNFTDTNLLQDSNFTDTNDKVVAGVMKPVPRTDKPHHSCEGGGACFMKAVPPNRFACIIKLMGQTFEEKDYEENIWSYKNRIWLLKD
jgi:hypothetical protein